MNYNKLTKAQLIDKIHELETDTLSYKFESFVLESQLFIEDLIKIIKFVFLMGTRLKTSYTNSQFPSLIDELRTRTKDLYSQGTSSDSQSSEHALVLLPRETRVSLPPFLSERAN